MRGETPLLQAQLGLGPRTPSDACLHLIPVTHGMHRCSVLADAQELQCRQALRFRWEVEHTSVSRGPEHSL